ncbi:hereditary hemochromatosis protein homolog isoform X2 [Mus pahari]|uniref:hereditary hemochromatosis protein homolog isoform X2 n=1 Tax=Mus pahari TaxID=10093 RepID=UPI000A310F1D|nr:hereditary hemochromatosis protein homolog isoform X2 [Mus pahari]
MKATSGKPREFRPAVLLLILKLLLRDSQGSSTQGTHTLRYIRAHSLEGSEKTWLLVLIYVDEELFLKYNGDSREMEPLGCWIKGHGGNETCARETKNLWKEEERLRGMMAETVNQKSQEKGLHTLQATLGCELLRNGSTRGFWHLGYDGQNLLTFDQKTLTWTVDVPSAQQNKTFWETRAPRADRVKTFLDDICPAQLQRRLASLRNVLQDTGPPMVTVTFRNYPVGRVTLTCQAFNLYARVATLAWLQDGKPVQQKTFGPETILPSGDGTYQAWVSIRVLPGQEPQFSCYLKHGNHSVMPTAVSGHTAEDSQDAASSATA